MPDATAAALLARNKRAFKRYYPSLGEWLGGDWTFQSSLTLDQDGVAQNICIGDTNVYPAPAKEWTEGQLRGFLNESPRLVFDNINHCNPSEISAKLVDVLHPFMEKLGNEEMVPAPSVDTGFAFIFGVGLGYHLDELLSKLKVRHFVLIEPVAEFLVHSLGVTDWAALFRKAKAKGVEIHFIVNDDPEQISRAVEQVFIHKGAEFIEGSYFYYHYYSWALAEANSLLSVSIKHHIYSTGFYEDECLMMSNAIANITQYDFRICEAKAMVQVDSPVFVIGSGPSLDNDIEAILQWKDKAIVISCGTTLSILLSKGIRPRFHIELENGPRTRMHIAKIAETYGSLDDIILVSSITINPDAAAYFAEKWFLFRVALSPGFIFRGPHTVMTGAEPSVSNGGFAVAAHSGFRQIYLFGVDCGYREGTSHHAKDSIYFHDKRFDLGDVDPSFDRTLPGNFGGTFRSNYVFDMTARGISEVKRHFRSMTLYNCSDGARIDGALPKASASIQLADVKVAPEATIQRIRQQWIHYDPREMLKWCDPEALIGGCATYDEEMRRFLEEAKALRSFYDVMAAFKDFIRALPESCKGVRAVVDPSIQSMLRISAFYGTRVTNPRKRQKVLEFCMDAIKPVVTEMCDGTAKVFEKLRG